MLYRDEFPSIEPSGCLYNQNVLAKIKQLENELSDFEDQLAAQCLWDFLGGIFGQAFDGAIPLEK